MDYNDVPLFIRVVENGSFTKAAEALGVQKSSVSRSLGRLEDELGVRLLQRTTRQLALTDAGQAFYERVRSALSGLDEAAATVRDLGSKPRGVIRMTAPSDTDAFGIAESIAEFVRRYPDVRVELMLTGRVVDLVAEGFDLALRAGPLIDSSLITRSIGTTDLVLLAAPAYLKRRGRPQSLSDLAKHDCVLFRGRNGSALWTLLGPSGSHDVEVKGQISSDQMSFALRACVAGAGIGLIPPALAREAVQRKELEVVLPGYHVAGTPLHLVLPSSTFIPARVALLRDHLIEHVQRVTALARAECSAHQQNIKGGSRTRSKPSRPLQVSR
jgi:DNA-binding transcriptional LysR family regulator